MSIRTLDLFAGIGGFSLALKSISTTVAYCEIDQECQQVLRKGMQRGELHNASILHDVRHINASDIKRLKPSMITAGFPCTDISSANPQGQGLKGLRSGLFKEILRIIDSIPTIDIVFLENSPRIMVKGFDIIKKSMKMRGYKLKYCLIEAKDVGALHRRKRWYCLCYKPSITKLPIIHERYLKHSWSDANTEATLIKLQSQDQKAKCTTRLQKLGNAVVPQCASFAWNSLAKSINEYNHTQYIRIQPYLNSSPPNITISDGDHTYHKKYWATPTHSVWFHNKILSRRASTILSNQLYYDTSLSINNKTESRSKYIANPRFVETLMGYPKDWTKPS